MLTSADGKALLESIPTPEVLMPAIKLTQAGGYEAMNRKRRRATKRSRVCIFCELKAGTMSVDDLRYHLREVGHMGLHKLYAIGAELTQHEFTPELRSAVELVVRQVECEFRVCVCGR